MAFRYLSVLLAAGFLSASAPAFAQNMLNEGELVTSLQQLETAATSISAASLRQQAQASVQSDRHANAVGRPPLSPDLATLRQLWVEIDFAFNSAAIQPKSFRTVGMMADALHHPYLLQYKFLVIGHTDATGGRKYNLELSQRRADAVRDALVTVFRVSPDRVQAVGLGEEQLRDPAHPDAAVNRRVQLINIGKVRGR